MSDGEGLWIFGYGSLVWRPAFDHDVACRAWIAGFVRRFWQGSIDHRGVPERPGRVVTLVPREALAIGPSARLEPETDVEERSARRCWGVAYRVAPARVAGVLAQLDRREQGGYERVELEIRLEPGGSRPRSVHGLVYRAGPDNPHYLGPAPLESIAGQIAGAHGPSGANDEYVFALADALRRMGVGDPHVFALEALLHRLRGGTGPDVQSPARSDDDGPWRSI